jgi:hypothetical protein
MFPLHKAPIPKPPGCTFCAKTAPVAKIARKANTNNFFFIKISLKK